MSEILSFTATASDGRTRLDKFLASRLPDLSRSRIQALIVEGCAQTGGQAITDCAFRVKPGQTVALTIPKTAPAEMKGEDIPLKIIYEDEHLLVIDKPAGMVVHPGAGNPGSTLANALLHHCGDSLSGIGGEARPGIVHRLDKDTSGLLTAAKHDKAHHGLSRQIKNRTLTRIYYAFTWGVPFPPAGIIQANLGRSVADRRKVSVYKTAGKPAVTHYRVVETFGDIAALVECRLETGRTHQIRVHMAFKNHPLIGDQTYGGDTANRFRQKITRYLPEESLDFIRGFPRQALHSTRLAFTHPVSGEFMEFGGGVENFPPDMAALLRHLREGIKRS